MLEAIILTCVIDTHENHEVAVVDIPNAFIQTEHEGKMVHMKFRGQLATIFCSTAPEVYKQFMVYENYKPVIYLKVLKVIYGLLESTLLFYKKLRKM
jgi:hypothetical protein